jgi:hypothetical protein
MCFMQFVTKIIAENVCGKSMKVIATPCIYSYRQKTNQRAVITINNDITLFI